MIWYHYMYIYIHLHIHLHTPTHTCAYSLLMSAIEHAWNRTGLFRDCWLAWPHHDSFNIFEDYIGGGGRGGNLPPWKPPWMLFHLPQCCYVYIHTCTSVPPPPTLTHSSYAPPWQIYKWNVPPFFCWLVCVHWSCCLYNKVWSLARGHSSSHSVIWTITVINPRRAPAVRVTVVGSVCVSIYQHLTSRASFKPHHVLFSPLIRIQPRGTTPPTRLYVPRVFTLVLFYIQCR